MSGNKSCIARDSASSSHSVYSVRRFEDTLLQYMKSDVMSIRGWLLAWAPSRPSIGAQDAMRKPRGERCDGDSRRRIKSEQG